MSGVIGDFMRERTSYQHGNSSLLYLRSTHATGRIVSTAGNQKAAPTSAAAVQLSIIMIQTAPQSSRSALVPVQET